MRALDTKLSRDLARLWAQALAIALVIAGGVATIVLAVGPMRSLDETRIGGQRVGGRVALASWFA